MSTTTVVAEFSVVSGDGAEALPTSVCHHVDEEGYELFSITQPGLDGNSEITVLLHRDQLAALAGIAKGH